MTDGAEAAAIRRLQVPGLLLTGHPSSGKSTLATALAQSLWTRGVGCEVLDGDELRARLPPPLGFTREDRGHQFVRGLFVAELLAAHGVIPIMALVAPFAEDRELARQRFTEVGWIEVFLDPPHDVCLQRDSRGLYAALAARGGSALIATEVLAPYERPTAPTLRLDTARVDVETATTTILRALDVS